MDHPATKMQWVARDGIAGRRPFPGPLTMMRLRNDVPGDARLPALDGQPPVMGELMKRPKRNRIQRAFDKGYQLGLAGRPKENCPFLTGLARNKWLEGWREGRNDWREGLTDALTCYKLSGF
jgi:ribosome modulation factor